MTFQTTGLENLNLLVLERQITSQVKSTETKHWAQETKVSQMDVLPSLRIATPIAGKVGQNQFFKWAKSHVKPTELVKHTSQARYTNFKVSSSQQKPCWPTCHLWQILTCMTSLLNHSRTALLYSKTNSSLEHSIHAYNPLLQQQCETN